MNKKKRRNWIIGGVLAVIAASASKSVIAGINENKKISGDIDAQERKDKTLRDLANGGIGLLGKIK